MAQGVPAEAMKSLPSTTVRVLKGLPSIAGKEVAVPQPSLHACLTMQALTLQWCSA